MKRASFVATLPSVPRSFRDAVHVLPTELRDGRLDRALRSLYSDASWTELRRLIETGKVTVDGARVADAGETVRGGQSVEIRMAAPRREAHGELSRGVIEYLDAEVVLVKKPAGVSTVPFDDGEQGALSQRLLPLLRRIDGAQRKTSSLGIVHRIDKETSGLVVFARTFAAKRHLAQQFREHTVTRRYVALAHGDVREGTFQSRLVQDRGDGLRGSTTNPKLGLPSTTHVRVLERLANTTLIECKLETGRTHQIRIHLSEAGHPLLGERAYVRGFAGEQLAAPRLMLHAAALGFVHPRSGERLEFTQPWPPDFVGVLSALGAATRGP